MADSRPQFGWQKGDALTAENLNTKGVGQQITVGPGLTMIRAGNCITIALSQGNSSSSMSATVKISSAVSGQVGRYYGKVLSTAPNGSATGALAEANLGSVPSADDAVIWHVPEIKLASAKHMLVADAHYEGRYVGTNSDGKKIILISAMPIGETASPTTLGAASEGSEAADSSTWSRTTNGTPLQIYIQTRTAYYDAGDEKLYGYFRLFTYDACGLLISVGAETRVEVDVPEAC